MWRTTGNRRRRNHKRCHFNPRPPCGGRHQAEVDDIIKSAISIHVPRVEDDFGKLNVTSENIAFQSTSPVWRTTSNVKKVRSKLHRFQSTSPVWRTTEFTILLFDEKLISIHVPRVEDDSRAARSSARQAHFNPRPPCGGRPRQTPRRCFWRTFQSTSPVWRTTVPLTDEEIYELISIHVPRVEDDRRLTVSGLVRCRFQSTSPVWRTTKCAGKYNPQNTFQSTSPVWRTTYPATRRTRMKCISIHVPRVEDDFLIADLAEDRRIFQSTSPVWRTTRVGMQTEQRRHHFNPRPPCGGRPNEGEDFRKVLEISIHVPRVEDDGK